VQIAQLALRLNLIWRVVQEPSGSDSQGIIDDVSDDVSASAH
jgi:hypothetical protein